MIWCILLRRVLQKVSKQKPFGWNPLCSNWQIWIKFPSCFCRSGQNPLHVFADPDKFPFMFLQTRTKFPSCFCRPGQNSLHVFADPDKIPFMFLQTQTKFPSCFCRPGQNSLHVFADPNKIPFMFLQTRTKSPSDKSISTVFGNGDFIRRGFCPWFFTRCLDILLFYQYVWH